MTVSLPQIVCEGCGACCRHVGTPPGFYPAYAIPEHEGKYFTDAPDWEYWQAMPESVKRELRTYYLALRDRKVANRELAKVPCLWLDEATGRCRHYEYRPEACRTAVLPGDDSCLEFRAQAGKAD